MKNVCILLLAAGSSSRLGQSKQLLKFNGKSLLRLSAEAAVQSLSKRVVVILGSHAKLHREEIADLDLSIVINERWKNGIGSSIKSGLKFVQEHFTDCDSVLVMVCDQPHISTAQLDLLIKTFNESSNKIAASAYGETLGVPAIFDKQHFKSLSAIGDSKGAKTVIESNPSEVEAVPFPDGHVDIDTMEDYSGL